MPTEVQTGTAVVHGIRNNGSSISMTGYATFILDTVKGQHKFALEAIQDELGFDKALVATNAHTETDITWTPSGATKAAAEATAAFILPLAKVTLANFAISAFNGDWVYVGDGSIDLSKKQGKMSLKIRKYADATQNSSLTTTAS